MVFYWIFWIIFLLLFIANNGKNRAQNAILTVILVVLAFFVGCRLDVGADWGSYIGEYYNSTTDLDHFREPLFLLIAKVMSGIGLPYPWFFFILALVQLFCLKKAAEIFGINSIGLSFLLFFSLFFCITTLNVVRHGLMIALIWLGLSYKCQGNYKQFIICILLGASFHFMTIIVCPFLFLIDKELSKRQMLICIVICFIALNIGFSEKLFNAIPYVALLEKKMTYYTSDAFLSESSNLTMGQIFDLFIMLLTFVKFHKLYSDDIRIRVFVNSLLFSFIISCFLNFYGVFVERISQIFKFSLMFLIPFIYDYYYLHKAFYIEDRRHQRGRYKIIINVIIIAYSILYMNKTINIPDPADQKEYQFQPYKTEIFNYFRDDKPL